MTQTEILPDPPHRIGWALAALMAAGGVAAVLALLGRIGAGRKVQGVIETLVHYPGVDVIESRIALAPGWPGHTAGHMSLLLTLPEGAVILAADAINRRSEPAEGFPDAADPVTAATSAARLHALQTETGALMIWGHDPDQWRSLPKAPAPFRR